MSHHILHILRHGSVLRKQRGQLVCTYPDDEAENRMAIEDVRAVIVAARGVSITQDLVCALMVENAVILHCDNKYKPVAVTAGLERVVRKDILHAQANTSLKLHDRIWNRILLTKTMNQAVVLEKYGKNTTYLRRSVEKKIVDEASCARYYWDAFFSLLSDEPIIRRHDDIGGLNAKLNYGYAVLGALLHRSIIAHGLSPLFGIQHIPRYKSHAFVYDLVEAWRQYVDAMLVEYQTSLPPEEITMQSWARTVAENLKNRTIRIRGKKYKLLDALDIYTSSVARCYEKRSITHIWMPEMKA